jgi:hypothetical protein
MRLRSGDFVSPELSKQPFAVLLVEDDHLIVSIILTN